MNRLKSMHRLFQIMLSIFIVIESKASFQSCSGRLLKYRMSNYKYLVRTTSGNNNDNQGAVDFWNKSQHFLMASSPLLSLVPEKKTWKFSRSLLKISKSRISNCSPCNTAARKCLMPESHRLTLLKSSAKDENEKKVYDDKKEEPFPIKLTSSPVETTIKDKVEVLSYRTALLIASLGYGTLQLSTFIESSSSGLSPQILHQIQESSHLTIDWGTLITALLAPSYREISTPLNDKSNEDRNSNTLSYENAQNDKDDYMTAILLLLNEALPTAASFAIVIELVNTIQSNFMSSATTTAVLTASATATVTSTSESNLDGAANFFITAICLREIAFFGIAFKVEAVLVILFILLQVLDLRFTQGTLSGGIALCLLVLSFGKFFEPIRDDLRPGKSAFLRDDRLQ